MTWREGLARRFKAVREATAEKGGEPMPQVIFAQLLDQVATELFGDDVEHRYGQSLVNRLEKGGQPPTLQDVAVYAAVDRQRRGKLWLGWNERDDASLRSVEAIPASAFPDAPTSRTQRRGKTA